MIEWGAATGARVRTARGREAWQGVVHRYTGGTAEFHRCPHPHRSSTAAKRCADRAARKMNAKARARVRR